MQSAPSANIGLLKKVNNAQDQQQIIKSIWGVFTGNSTCFTPPWNFIFCYDKFSATSAFWSFENFNIHERKSEYSNQKFSSDFDRVSFLITKECV